MLQEIDSLKAIKCAGILRLHKVFLSVKYVYLILDYLDGGELKDRIKSLKRYEENDAIRIMANLLKALDHIHSKNVVHRDLKPENLILVSKEDDFDVRIADFGLATIMNKPLFERCGTPGFVAPEILSGKGYDFKVDIFSMGAILYFLLTGKHAFRGCNPASILRNNEECKVEFPEAEWKQISEQAKDLVQKMLCKDPAQRISTKEARKHKWLHPDTEYVSSGLLSFCEDTEQERGYFINQIGDQEKNKLNLVTCTPLFSSYARRQSVKCSPYVNPRATESIATPLFRGRVSIKKVLGQGSQPREIKQINLKDMFPEDK